MTLTPHNELSKVPHRFAKKLLPPILVAERLGISKTTLWRLIRDGPIFKPAVRISRNRTGWPESEVAAWISERIANRDMGGAEMKQPENGSGQPGCNSTDHQNSNSSDSENVGEQVENGKLKPPTDAMLFLQTLDSSADLFCFQTFDDVKITQPDGSKKNRSQVDLVGQSNASLEIAHPRLIRSNKQGAGIFVTVNETDGKGRKTKNIIRIRCIFSDDDDGFAGNFPIPPTMTIETSPGKYQHYWMLKLGEELIQEQFKKIMQVLVAKYGADSNAKDVARVLRLPGYYHNKNPDAPFMARIVGQIGQHFTATELMTAFPHVDYDQTQHKNKKPNNGTYQGHKSETTEAEIHEALFYIPADDRDTWLQIGMALKAHFGESGYSIWCDWSRQSVKFDEHDQRKKWDSFKGEGVNIGTLFENARENGCDLIELTRKYAKMNGYSQQGAASKGSPKQKEKETKPKLADQLIEFVLSGYELFHDDNSSCYSCDKSGVVFRLDGQPFASTVKAAFYKVNQTSATDGAYKEALSVLDGLALHDGECRPVHIRVCKHDSGYLIDLAESANNRAIYVQPDKWKIIESPVYFYRPPAMMPLAKPVQGGDISALWDAANIPQADRLLVIAWLIECWRPDTPFPILELIAMAGTAKSTTTEALRRITDPNRANLRSAISSPDDLFVIADSNHVICMENISNLTSAMQDAICVVATGGGYAKRKLYTDCDEIVLKVKRPILINGISAAITRTDAIDRAISLELPPIKSVKSEPEIWQTFEACRGQIMGGLLDIMAAALTFLPDMELSDNERPRLYDFALMGMAVAQAMNKKPAVFINQFNERRYESTMRTIDTSPVATALVDWFEGKNERQAPLKTLLKEIENYRPQRAENWPRSVKGFGDALRRAAPALRQLGIKVENLGKIGGNYQWLIRRSINKTAKSRPASPASTMEIGHSGHENRIIYPDGPDLEGEL